jgi:TRAP-type uncharacterized transport system substrate-binding protein
LGSLYFEPTWVFVRDGAAIVELTDLRGKRVFAGRPGSDARATAHALLRVFGVADLVDSKPYEELDAIEDATRNIHIPQMHIAHYFEFRQYIHDLRSRLEEL